MKVLITGGTGFVGSHLLQLLVEQGKEIVLLKRSTSDLNRISSLLSSIQTYDIDTIDIENIFKQNEVDQIIHLATDYGRTDDFLKCNYTNVVLPLQLLQTGYANGVKRFIAVDTFSSLVDKLDYLPAYHITKRHFREWGTYIAAKQEKEFITAFLQHPYGPKDNPNKFTSYLFKSLIEQIPFMDLTAGIQKRDFIHVTDVASALLSILEASVVSPVLEIGTGQSISIKDFVIKVKSLAGNNSTKLNFGKLPTRSNEIMDAKADTSAMRRLNWDPKVELDNGILDLISWFKKTNHHIPISES